MIRVNVILKVINPCTDRVNYARIKFNIMKSLFQNPLQYVHILRSPYKGARINGCSISTKKKFQIKAPTEP